MRTYLAIAAVFVLASPTMRATTLIASDVGALARDAHAIARGRVVAVEARLTADHHGIETVVTLSVDAYLKGALGSTLTFRVPGGEVGRFRSIFVGAPQFAVDEQVIVFVGAHGPTVPYILGLSEG